MALDGLRKFTLVWLIKLLPTLSVKVTLAEKSYFDNDFNFSRVFQNLPVHRGVVVELPRLVAAQVVDGGAIADAGFLFAGLAEEAEGAEALLARRRC